MIALGPVVTLPVDLDRVSEVSQGFPTFVAAYQATITVYVVVDPWDDAINLVPEVHTFRVKRGDGLALWLAAEDMS
jgi:ABC-type nitrate/sulfonate/bicarbonate transport system substrate-binding protein